MPTVPGYKTIRDASRAWWGHAWSLARPPAGGRTRRWGSADPERGYGAGRTRRECSTWYSYRVPIPTLNFSLYD
jgi:hypothetical protein